MKLLEKAGDTGAAFIVCCLVAGACLGQYGYSGQVRWLIDTAIWTVAAKMAQDCMGE